MSMISIHIVNGFNDSYDYAIYCFPHSGLICEHTTSGYVMCYTWRVIWINLFNDLFSVIHIVNEAVAYIGQCSAYFNFIFYCLEE